MNKYILYFFSLMFIFGLTFGNFNLKTTIVSAADQRLETAQAELVILQAEYDNFQVEMVALEKKKEGKNEQSTSVDRDISILKTKIKKSQLDIQAKNLLIKNLGGEDFKKDKKNNILNERIDKIKESLSQLIRKNREIDEKSILSLILSKDTIAEAYGDINNYASIKKDIGDQVLEIKRVKALKEEEEPKLEQIENKEAPYQKILDEKAKRRAEILAVLFNLRDTAAIPFSKALEYANLASQKTGIRPAFLLAILTQESDLGENVGTCNRNISEPTWDKIMPGPIHYANYLSNNKSCKGTKFPCSYRDDQKIYKNLTIELGRPLVGTPLSCPMGGSGYGGGMGPSQFIPSTWNGLKGKVASMLGIKTPDPWYPRDAFMASSIYLTDLGAGAQTYTAERNAACKYYSGRICDSKSPANTFYGDQVMAKTANIQTNMIDPLQD